MPDGAFKSIQEVFSTLNKRKQEYVVMRNYDILFTASITEQDRPNIDILCADPCRIAELLGATPKMGDSVRYYIIINDRRVELTLRTPKDGYFCEQWAVDMLRRRRMLRNIFVLNRIDQFYSHLYHALVQCCDFEPLRPSIADGIKLRGYRADVSTETLMLELEAFMRCNGYRFGFLEDASVPLLWKRISDRSLLDFDRRRHLEHLFAPLDKIRTCSLWLIRHALTYRHRR